MSWSLSCEAFLFDLDGTLIQSLHAVDRAWTAFANKHGFEPAAILPKIHGRRSIDSVRALLPNADAIAEDAYLRHLEATLTEGVVAFPGVPEFLASLPPNRWGLVTSGTSDVARARLQASGITEPNVAVFGEDVQRGKPAPDPYLEGARKLGIDPERCAGFEDAPAGIASIEAAGMAAVGYRMEVVTLAFTDYRNLRVELAGGEMLLTCLD